jgi:hypothetical protein
MECLFFRHATDANDAFLDGGGEGSSVSVEARRACALFGWRVESERSGFEREARPPARGADARIRALTQRNRARPARVRPRIPDSETGNQKTKKRFLERFPLARSPRQRGAAATGGVRAPANERARGFPAGRTFGDDVETRVEVASGLCHGGRPWTRSASRDISRAIGSLRIEICASSVTASAYVPTVLNNSAPPPCLHQKAHSARAPNSRDSRRHRESSSSVSTPRCRRRGWPVEMAAPQPGDDIDTLLFGA